MKLWLDDRREPPDESWVWVKTSDEAIRTLALGGVEEASLDHDLGVVRDGREATGYDVLEWLEERVAIDGFVPPLLKAHSANPPARRRMEQAIIAIQRLARPSDTESR
jgi:hypothetical protein